MNIERKNGCKPNSSQTRGTNMKRLVLSLSICVMTLTGCASSPTVIAPNCPEPAPIPVALSESDLPAALNYSRKVQAWLTKVQDYLKK